MYNCINIRNYNVHGSELESKKYKYCKKKILVFVEEKCTECILERKFSSSLFQK